MDLLERVRPYVLVGGTAVMLGGALLFGRDDPPYYGFLSGVLDNLLLVPNLIASQTDELNRSFAQDGDGILSEPRRSAYALGFSTLGTGLRILTDFYLGCLLLSPYLYRQRKNKKN